ncbi:MAG: HDOD domain-containing protein, partial [Planctomycetaceae bacterium]
MRGNVWGLSRRLPETVDVRLPTIADRFHIRRGRSDPTAVDTLRLTDQLCAVEGLEMVVASSSQNVDWEKLTEKALGDVVDGQLPPWVKLPALPSAATDCLQIAHAPEVAPSELAEPIQKDSGLTCLILRHVNSS